MTTDRGGPPRRFPPDVARARRVEQTRRYHLKRQLMLDRLRISLPPTFRSIERYADERIAAELGPLPGDDLPT